MKNIGLLRPTSGVAGLQKYLEQALVPGATENLNLDQYLQGVNLASGFHPAAVSAKNIGAANKVLSSLFKDRPELFRGESFTPWASEQDWIERQNARPGFNEGAGISDFVKDIPGDVARVGKELWAEPGVRQLALTAAGGAYAGSQTAPAAGTGTAAGGTGLNATYAPTALGGTGASGLGVSAGYAPPAFGGTGTASLGLDVGLAGTASAAGAGAGAGGTAAPASGGTASRIADVATILTPVASLLAAASGMNAAKAVANAPSQMIIPPTPQPVLGGPNTILATRGAVTEQLRRRGRAATIMTEPKSETLGS